MGSSEQFSMISGAKYVQMQKESSPAEFPMMMSSFLSFNPATELTRIFDELPKATIVQVSRPDPSDISPMLLGYTIELQYRQFKWQLAKKASQVFYLHFALKKRKFLEEIHEKQEQVREWLQNLGIGDHATVMQDDEEQDDEAIPSRLDGSARNRDVPSSAAIPIIRPALGRQHSILEQAKAAMQGYLNHFLSNIDIVNSQEVICGSRNIKLRTKSNAKVKDWVAAINDAGLRPPEGWCHPHCFGSFAPPRGLTEDGSQVQWFIDGRAAFEAIALAI